MRRTSYSSARLLLSLAVVLTVFASHHALRADTAPQALPFVQDWTNTALITADGNWAGVPGIIGYRGDDLTTATGTDPQTILADGSGTPVNVEANETNPNTFATGGVAEFHITNPTIALNGSGTADAPHIVLTLDTTGRSGIAVSYNLRDLDGSIDNTVMPVALQYRVGTSGPYTNLPAGFVADATSGPSLATLVTPVSAALPAAADNQPVVQVRIITANAVGNDEWVGIDDLSVTEAATPPTGIGAASPTLVAPGQNVLLTVDVTPGSNPVSTGLQVTADLTPIGGLASEALVDNGTLGDETAGDNTFSLLATVGAGTPPGPVTITATISDAETRSSTTTIAFSVQLLGDPVGSIPFTQNWSNTGLITANDNWASVTGIVGYLGDYTTSTPTGVDPQTLIDPMDGVAVDVIANQSNPNTLTAGGVAEFDGIADPTIALNGSGTADAPFILISVDTSGHTDLRIRYNLRDLDGSGDDAVQQVALQYRLGNSGSFTNLPAGFVSDATVGPNLAGLVTPVSVLLPAAVNNAPLVQFRIITSNANGADEWVGIDDIVIAPNTDPTDPVGVGTANPNSVEAGATSLLTVTVTPGTNPPSTGLAVTMDLQPVGGAAAQAFFDDGTNGDVTAGNNVFSYLATVAAGTTAGAKTLGGTVSDAQFRSTATSINLTVVAPVPFHAIAEIQGTGQQSPFAGLTVRTSGVVTGVRNNGFYIQTPDVDADGNAATSDGVFVFTQVAPPATATIGALVDVRGVVSEFVPSADPFQLPLTELAGSPTVTPVSTGNPLPSAVALTAADTDPSGPIDSLERYEGMRVSVASLTTIAPSLANSVDENDATGSSSATFYGVITGVPRPFREEGVDQLNPLPPGAPANVPRFDGNPERLRIVSNGLGLPPVEVAAGQVVTGVAGILDYGFRTYTIFPQSPLTIVGSVAAIPVETPTPGQFSVASANLQRFFDTVNDPSIGEPVLTSAAFERRLKKASLMIRNVLKTPDILGVVEMENLSTLQTLATRINNDAESALQPNPHYEAYLEEGNDIGGIDVGFLVKSTRVSTIDVVQINPDETYVNPNNGQNETLHDRPSLQLRAVVTSATGATFPITVIVNHLRSLSGVEDPADGNRIRTKRRAQAESLANYVQGRQQADPAERIILVGDFNAFQFNDGLGDSIGTIKGTPAPADQVVLASPDLVDPDLTNLVDLAAADQRYSFSFDGNAQTLDHALITPTLLALVDGLQYGRTNADFPESLRNDDTRPERISDHDPLVVFVNFPPPAPTSTVVMSSPNPSAAGQPVTFTATVSTSGGFAVTEGTVIFKEGATPLSGPLPLNSAGEAVFTTSTLGAGSRTIVAEYSGSGNFQPSQGSVTQIVNPSLSISDVAITEGNFNLAAATFTVTLSAASNLPVTVQFATANGSAVEWLDYVPRSLQPLTFPAGTTTQMISVLVIGDIFDEAAEQFFVNLSAPVNATLADAQGAATIVDNDAPPRLFVTDASITEGDSGTKTLHFVVGLTFLSGQEIAVDFATANGTAAAPLDFTAVSGTLTFPPGALLRTISVPIKGDTAFEADETFFVNLTNAINADVIDGQGRGTIVNDDRRGRH